MRGSEEDARFIFNEHLLRDEIWKEQVWFGVYLKILSDSLPEHTPCALGHRGSSRRAERAETPAGTKVDWKERTLFRTHG